MSDIQTRLAEVLDAHWRVTDAPPSVATRCICGWRSRFLPSFGGIREHQTHQAEQLSAVVKDAQAEAWGAGYDTGDSDRWVKSQDRRFENDNSPNPYRPTA